MAEAMARAGALVYLNGRDPEHTKVAADRLGGAGLTAHPLPFDVNDEKAGKAAIEAVAAQHGRLDILVNNVGQRLRAPIESITLDGLQGMLSTNVGGPFYLSKLAAPIMIRNGYGRIIMLSSASTRRMRAGDAAYIASKGAIETLTRALAGRALHATRSRLGHLRHKPMRRWCRIP
jgi:gluconate 5-dehydrogenase